MSAIASHKRAILSAVLAFILAGSLALPYVAYADPTAAEVQAEADEAQEKLDSAEDELDEAEAAYEEALAEQMEAEEAVEAAEEAVAEAEEKVAAAKAKVDEKTAEIEGYQEQLGTRARAMYRSGDTSFIDVILGASSFEEFATTWNMLERLNDSDADLIQKTKDVRAELEEAQAEAEAAQAEAEEAQAEAEEQAAIAAAATETQAEIQAEAEALVEEYQDLYDSLSEEAAELLAEEQAEAEAAALAAAQAKVSSSTGSVNNSKAQTVDGATVVARAKSQLGKPYKWGAVGPNSFDCSGLVSYCLTGQYKRICTTATIRGWTVVTSPKAGDICVNSHHTGIYIGNGQMIHAPSTGDVVKISAVHSDMWFVRY